MNNAIQIEPGLVVEVLIGVLLGKIIIYFLPKKFFKQQIEVVKIDWFWMPISLLCYLVAMSVCVHINQIPEGTRWFFPIMLDLATLMFFNALKGEKFI